MYVYPPYPRCITRLSPKFLLNFLEHLINVVDCPSPDKGGINGGSFTRPPYRAKLVPSYLPSLLLGERIIGGMRPPEPLTNGRESPRPFFFFGILILSTSGSSWLLHEIYVCKIDSVVVNIAVVMMMNLTVL